jgi:hypothetical protein
VTSMGYGRGWSPAGAQPARPAHREAAGAVRREAIAPSVTHTDASETSERQPGRVLSNGPSASRGTGRLVGHRFRLWGELGAGDRPGDTPVVRIGPDLRRGSRSHSPQQGCREPDRAAQMLQTWSAGRRSAAGARFSATRGCATCTALCPPTNAWASACLPLAGALITVPALVPTAVD